MIRQLIVSSAMFIVLGLLAQQKFSPSLSAQTEVGSNSRMPQIQN